MNSSELFAISAAGMNLERTRVEVATLNLANANTVVGGSGGSYRPLRVVASSHAATTGFSGLMGVQAAGPDYSVEAATQAPRKVYDAGHPLADAQGFVSYAGVDPAKEMMTLLSASRAYEANVAAMNVSRMMTLKALDIGGNA